MGEVWQSPGPTGTAEPPNQPGTISYQTSNYANSKYPYGWSHCWPLARFCAFRPKASSLLVVTKLEEDSSSVSTRFTELRDSHAGWDLRSFQWIFYMASSSPVNTFWGKWNLEGRIFEINPWQKFQTDAIILGANPGQIPVSYFLSVCSVSRPRHLFRIDYCQ